MKNCICFCKSGHVLRCSSSVASYWHNLFPDLGVNLQTIVGKTEKKMFFKFIKKNNNKGLTFIEPPQTWQTLSCRERSADCSHGQRLHSTELLQTPRCSTVVSAAGCTGDGLACWAGWSCQSLQEQPAKTPGQKNLKYLILVNDRAVKDTGVWARFQENWFILSKIRGNNWFWQSRQTSLKKSTWHNTREGLSDQRAKDVRGWRQNNQKQQ